MKYKKHFALGFVFLALPYSALADDSVKPYSTENEWNSSQISAAGGIGQASDNVVDLFFSDPSIVAQNKRKFVLQFASLDAVMSSDLVSTVSDISKFSEASETSSSTDSNTQMISALDKFKSVFGRRITGGVNLSLFSLKIGGFSMVPYMSGFLRALPQVYSWPRATATTDVYAGLGLGYAYTFAKDWDVGVNVRPGYRYYLTAGANAEGIGGDLTGSGASSTTASTTTSSALQSSNGGGMYFPVDIAGAYNLNKAWRFSLVLRDFGGAPALTSTDDAPPVYPMRINLGASWEIYSKGMHQVQALTELQDLRNIAAHENAWQQRLQWAGIYKFRLPSRADTSFGLITGMQSGYPSIGMLVDLFIFKLEGTLYEVEGAAYTGQRPERRYSAKAYTQLAF